MTATVCTVLSARWFIEKLDGPAAVVRALGQREEDLISPREFEASGTHWADTALFRTVTPETSLCGTSRLRPYTQRTCDRIQTSAQSRRPACEPLVSLVSVHNGHRCDYPRRAAGGRPVLPYPRQPRTTRFYDRTKRQVTRNIVERISI